MTKIRYYVFFVRSSHQYTTINYPVCSQHRLLARVAGIVSARNLINLAIGVMWAYAVFVFAIGAYGLVVEGTVAWDVFVFCAVIVVLGIGIFEFGRRFTPIKVKNATESTVSLSFRSDDYARAFENANSRIVVSKVPRSKPQSGGSLSVSRYEGAWKKDVKKIIIIGYCIAMAIAAIYVPWKVDYHTGRYSAALDGGYSFFFLRPVPVATIDYGKLLLEFVVISAVAGVLYVVSNIFEDK